MCVSTASINLFSVIDKVYVSKASALKICKNAPISYLVTDKVCVSTASTFLISLMHQLIS